MEKSNLIPPAQVPETRGKTLEEVAEERALAVSSSTRPRRVLICVLICVIEQCCRCRCRQPLSSPGRVLWTLLQGDRVYPWWQFWHYGDFKVRTFFREKPQEAGQGGTAAAV